jgi:tetratricopeptide (TPR) repeat protein
MIAVLDRAADGWLKNDVEYWDLLTFSYHAVNDRTRELATARAARRRFPDRIDVIAFELSALAAEGRVSEVRALLDSAQAFPRAKLGVSGVIADMPGLGLWPARLMISAATEFRAHGFSAEAKETFQRAIDWYETQQPADLPESSYRFELARAYYHAGNLASAQAMFRSLFEADPNAFVYSGFLGTIAARSGDSTTARRIHARFDSLRPTLSRPHAIAGYWQSKISAVLGDTAGAMRSLNEAFGPQGRPGIHGEFDYERIAKSRMFREFVRPKG